MDASWTHDEFASTDLGDVRLNRRLAIISRQFAQSPLSPINHACDDWAETKAAYRFFSNDKIKYHEISQSHIAATKERCREFSTVLAIQDTTYFNYSQHPQTKGLCPLSRNKGLHQKEIVTLGLVMHSTLAVSTDGLPLGIVDQKIYSRPQPAEKMTAKQRSAHNYVLPTEDKDNYRWLESLKNTSDNLSGIQSRVVTICDREADMFDIFLIAQHVSMPLIVRANHNRSVNKKTTHSHKTGQKLWSLLEGKKCEATITVQIPKRDTQETRTAVCEVRFTDFVLNRPLNYVEGAIKNAPNLDLFAIYVSEINCPKGSEPIDWMLLTNLPIQSREQALEKVSWYCLRWRIETWHKVLKSGLQVEDCRLSTSARLIRYLAVMSIVAWRIFWITLVGRVAPDASCRIFLNDVEWKILATKFAKTPQQKKQPPTLDQSIRWIAQLGGFLARKGDKQPGITHIWRGMKKFAAIIEGASLVKDICG